MSDQEIIVAMTELNGTVKALHHRFDKHEQEFIKRQDKIEETIYGNGRPGLTTSVQVIETKHSNLISRLKVWGSIFTAIIIAALLTVLGLA
tara:strand:+ start:514 stop:786 length:273 start_codon:yes stop_codon:yes gene_type:complete